VEVRGVAIAERLDAFQRRHPSVAFPIAVVYKYFDDSGGYLAALIAYYGFVSLFPLLLLLSTVLGYALSGDPALQQRVLNSALQHFPVVGGQLLDDPKRIGGGSVGLVVGILGSLYGALGVAQATQYAMNTAWSIPRNSRPNPFKARGRSLLLLMTAGLALIGTTVLSAIGSPNAGSLGDLLRVTVFGASVVLNVIVFVFGFRIATARDLSIREVAPGALVAAVIWQLLQSFGVLYINHVIRHASATNGVFALVLGLIAFLYLTAVVVVMSVEINAVRVNRLHPRALLTPFTDAVDLTSGDERAYTKQAKAQRMKGFEEVSVAFDPPENNLDS
jgi:membrane protein